MGQKYYIADTHFGHSNVIKFDERPFDDTKTMEETIVKNWNDRVTKDDTVYILGDFCWDTEKEWLRILDRLNGLKVLIRGNHDLKNPSATLKKKFLKIVEREEVTDHRRRIILDHYPQMFYRGSYGKDIWHFCGHTHNRTNEELKRQSYVLDLIINHKEEYDNRGHIINVGCMMPYVDYTPRTADELINWWHKYYIEKDTSDGIEILNVTFVDNPSKEKICPYYGKNSRECYKCKHVAYNFDSELDCNVSGVIVGKET